MTSYPRQLARALDPPPQYLHIKVKPNGDVVENRAAKRCLRLLEAFSRLKRAPKAAERERAWTALNQAGWGKR